MDVNAKRANSRIKEIEIMDCTLRDGEQTNGVSFLPHEKLMIARILLHDINGYKKHCLENGLDDVDFLVQNRDKVEAWEAKNK